MRPLEHFPLARGYPETNGNDGSPVVVTAESGVEALSFCRRAAWSPELSVETVDLVGTTYTGRPRTSRPHARQVRRGGSSPRRHWRPCGSRSSSARGRGGRDRAGLRRGRPPRRRRGLHDHPPLSRGVRVRHRPRGDRRRPGRRPRAAELGLRRGRRLRRVDPAAAGARSSTRATPWCPTWASTRFVCVAERGKPRQTADESPVGAYSGRGGGPRDNPDPARLGARRGRAGRRHADGTRARQPQGPHLARAAGRRARRAGPARPHRRGAVARRTRRPTRRPTWRPWSAAPASCSAPTCSPRPVARTGSARAARGWSTSTRRPGWSTEAGARSAAGEPVLAAAAARAALDAARHPAGAARRGRRRLGAGRPPRGRRAAPAGPPPARRGADRRSSPPRRPGWPP